MFTHKILTKEELENGSIKLSVEFTDGTKAFTETIVPQDKAGFTHWLNDRLKSLNSLEEMKTEIVVGQPLDVSEPEVVKTPEEEARDAWVAKYRKWVRVKETLIDTGILTGNETQVQTFLQDVKTGFKPDYINFI